MQHSDSKSRLLVGQRLLCMRLLHERRMSHGRRCSGVEQTKRLHEPSKDMPDIQHVTLSEVDAGPCHAAGDAHVELPAHVQPADHCDAALQLSRLLRRAHSGSQDGHVLALVRVRKDGGDLCQCLPGMAEADAAQVVQDQGLNCRRQRPCICETAKKLVSMQLPAVLFQKSYRCACSAVSAADVLDGCHLRLLLAQTTVHEGLGPFPNISPPMCHEQAVRYPRR